MTISKIVTEASVQEKKEQVVGGMLPHERLFVSLKLRIIGYAKAFESNGLEYYLFNCGKHGKVIAYPQGYDAFLACPKCNMVSATDMMTEQELKDSPIRGAELHR